MTPECRLFVFTRPPYVSVHFNLIVYPAVLLKQLTLVVAGGIASRISGLSVVMSKSSYAKKKKFLSSGQMASGHLLLVRTDAWSNVRLV